jgi:hypothetical protein
MDAAVALARAYLQLNGYFTVAEYPVLGLVSSDQVHMLTDFDLLAFRFPRAGRLIPGPGEEADQYIDFEPDPALRCDVDQPDMLIAEVKESRPRLNRATRQPEPLRAALVRFGCCDWRGSRLIVDGLLTRGHAWTAGGHRVRLVAFGSGTGPPRAPVHAVIDLGHVVEHLQEHLRKHWEVYRHAQFKDPAMSLLMTMEKALSPAGVEAQSAI